ncbi:uncharacterized protein V6R79_023397 [Siganus canaliculatus]
MCACNAAFTVQSLCGDSDRAERDEWSGAPLRSSQKQVNLPLGRNSVEQKRINSPPKDPQPLVLPEIQEGSCSISNIPLVSAVHQIPIKTDFTTVYQRSLPDPQLLSLGEGLKSLRPQPLLSSVLHGLSQLSMVDSRFGPVP